MPELTPKDIMTLGIAAYAAIVSTFVFGWDAYKWLNQGAKLRIGSLRDSHLTPKQVELRAMFPSYVPQKLLENATPTYRRIKVIK